MESGVCGVEIGGRFVGGVFVWLICKGFGGLRIPEMMA